MDEEYVVVVNEANEITGALLKASVHTQTTPLHRGFSIFLFDQDGRVLLQQRSRHKRTWPLVWSGSCCGHPALHENTLDAARRRVSFEIGITQISQVQEILPKFRYRCERDGIVENEICPVLVGKVQTNLVLNHEEVEACRWEDWSHFVKDISEHSSHYAEWCGPQVKELSASGMFQDFYREIRYQDN